MNNPISNIDKAGKWTIGISLGINLTAIFGFSINIGLYVDDKLNFDPQWSYSVPGIDDTMSFGFLDIGAGATIQYSNRDTVYDLYGASSTIGASGGAGWYVGGDLISFSSMNDSNAKVDGFQLTAGYGAGLDIHLANSKTKHVGNTTNRNNLYVKQRRTNRLSVRTEFKFNRHHNYNRMYAVTI